MARSRLEVKLTGIMNTMTLKPGESPRYGTEVAPRLMAPNHQHFFNARLDLDIDGEENTAHEVNTVSVPAGSENPHGNAFFARPPHCSPRPPPSGTPIRSSVPVLAHRERIAKK